MDAAIKVLSHIAFIGKIQGFVKQLRLGRAYHKEIKQFAKKTRAVDRYYLNHIFANCKQLKKLTLDYLELISFEADKAMGINSSLEILEISRSKYTSTTFIEFSARLPLLMQLYLIDSKLVSSERQDFIKIHMPQSSLNTIFCQRQLKDLNLGGVKEEFKYYLKLVTESGGEQCFESDGSKLEKCSLVDYESSLENQNVLSMDIQCKELKHLCLKIMASRYIEKDIFLRGQHCYF